jgi:hypothetical protein
LSFPFAKSTAALDGRDVRAFESDLGEAVLRDLHGGAGLLHLRPQLVHVGDREALVVGHDDHARVRKHAVERRDELAFCCSVHWALSGWRKGLPPVAPAAQGALGLRLEPPQAALSQALSPRPPEAPWVRWFEPIPFVRVDGR